MPEVRGVVVEALLGDESVSAYVLLNERLNLSLLPSSPSLAGAEVELVDELARESRLRKAIQKVAKRFDYVLIDCPPSLGLITLNMLAAADAGFRGTKINMVVMGGVNDDEIASFKEAEHWIRYSTRRKWMR